MDLKSNYCKNLTHNNNNKSMPLRRNFMSNYIEHLNSAMDKYETLRDKYNTIISTDEYQDTITSAPFKFLIGIHTYEILEMFNNAESGVLTPIDSLQEALSIYRNVVEYRKNFEQILNQASAIIDADEQVKEINIFVEESPYLSASLLIKNKETLVNLAKKCIDKFPKYVNLYTIKFKTRFIESCMESLNDTDLDIMVEEGIIKPTDLDMLHTVGSSTYEDALKHLCIVLDHKELVIENYKLQLVGVTYRNEDGINRQDILANLSAKIKAGEKLELKAEGYLYTPNVGNPEPAIKITNNDIIIGHIAADVVADIESKYKTPQYKAEIVGITGGKDGLSYGCDIMLSIISVPTMTKDPKVILHPATANASQAEKE